MRVTDSHIETSVLFILCWIHSAGLTCLLFDSVPVQKDTKNKQTKKNSLRSVCLHAWCYCPTSKVAQIKVKNKKKSCCCENKISQGFGTHDRAQDADGAQGTRGKKKEVKEAGSEADTRLKCPCASSSLEASRSCDGSSPASSLCSCCSLMLLALNTQTQRPRVSSRPDTLVHWPDDTQAFVFCVFQLQTGAEVGVMGQGGSVRSTRPARWRNGAQSRVLVKNKKSCSQQNTAAMLLAVCFF